MTDFTINSVTDYLKHIPSSSQMECRVAFRGQGADWPLVPSLCRTPHACVGPKASWQSYEQTILRMFQREAPPCLTQPPTDIIEWIALAQHYGVPTRLLDWSFSALHALYFAVDDLDATKDGIVWSYSASGYYFGRIEHYNDLYELDSVWLYMPRHLDQRMTSQCGCFTIHPLPKGAEPFSPFEPAPGSYFEWSRFRIPGASKEDIFHQLDDVGINAHLIYPDLDGLAREIRQRIRRQAILGPDHQNTTWTQKII